MTFAASMLASVDHPPIDWHALAPELIVLGVLAIIILVDAFGGEDRKWAISSITSIGLLVAIVPVVTMAVDGAVRSMFDAAYVVDNYALLFKALFLVAGYIVVLLSTNYIAEGDYWEGEYYQLLLASILGMMIMASARDLIGIFVALETISIPAYMLAAWRKRESRSDEAGLKYYLMGVFASGVLLYGMSLLYGLTGSTRLVDIAAAVSGEAPALVIVAIVFTIVGFGFKVSAVPFHTWAPDVYEGAPTPVTAFVAVASKAAGFVALITVVLVAFPTQPEIFEPLIWALAAATMTVGNVIALRQTNMVRLLAYSGVAQAGYMLAPLAIAGHSATSAELATSAIATYLVIYMAMNLGAFGIVIAMARKTGSAELSSYGGMLNYAPALTVAMTIFVFSLAGIPFLAGWYGKLAVVLALVQPGTWFGYSMAIIVGVNSVIALGYYAKIARIMWIDPAPDGDTTRVRVPVSVASALVITAVLTVAIGVYPPLVDQFTGAESFLTLGF
ncbi:MAG: NADH-quinone oxidoreductase subunit N [Acidimicrobiia bacterium]|nr:NADH-quinone oxidoreductase subunit N [Acidimicrobiia bacterium]